MSDSPGLTKTEADGWLCKNVRRLLTGLSFILFGMGSLNLTFAVLPVIFTLPANKAVRRRRIQNAISWHFRLFLNWIQWLKLMTLDVEGLERLRDDKGVIVIANHPTLIDVVVMMAFMPEVDCVVKEALNRNFFLRKIVRAAGYITNSAPRLLLQGCSKSLANNRNLIIFPEGTRSTPGKPLKFQRGVSHVALHTGHSIRPVYLKCEPASLSKHQKWYDIPDRPFVFSLRVGELIRTAAWQDDKPRGVQTRQLTRFLEQHYTQELPAYHGTT